MKKEDIIGTKIQVKDNDELQLVLKRLLEFGIDWWVQETDEEEKQNARFLILHNDGDIVISHNLRDFQNIASEYREITVEWLCQPVITPIVKTPGKITPDIKALLNSLDDLL